MAHSNDEEALESLASWLKSNLPAIIVGLMIGLGGYFGWTYWKNHQLNQSLQASAAYEKLLNQADKADAKLDEVMATARAIEKEFAGTIYANFTSLTLAKSLVVAGKNDEAVAELQKVIDHAEDPAFVQIARLRQARILLASKKYDESKQRVEEGLATDSAFKADFYDLQGDIAAAQNDFIAARDSWTEALKINPDSRLKTMLQLKLENLPATAQPKA